ncbi:MAG: DUF4160 domain-containing protein [Acidobacteriota bacterium]
MSPTVLQSGPYRFFFFASDRNEPPHVHVKREGKLAKFWLAPVRQAYKYGFSGTECNRIARIVRANEAALYKAWHDYFGIADGTNGRGKNSTGH